MAETNIPGIWAIGDVSGGPQFTQASMDDFRILRDNVFGDGSRSRSDRYVPSTLFTDPELAHVGLTEKEAVSQRIGGSSSSSSDHSAHGGLGQEPPAK